MNAKQLLIFGLFTLLTSKTYVSSKTYIGNQKNYIADQILGDWISLEEDLIVRCYKSNSNYCAKVIWFKEYHDNTADDPNGVPESQWNGSKVMYGFIYINKEWVNGEIWNLKNGKKYSAYIKMPDLNTLEVVGYRYFRFFSESIQFKRYTGNITR